MNDSRNPMLNNKRLANMRSSFGPADIAGTNEMTISGTINKTGLLLLIMVVGASFGWSSAMTPTGSALLMLGMIVGLVAFIPLMFKQTWAPVLAPVYAFAEGLVLGVISGMFESRYPGIAFNAMALTFGDLGVMLLLYRMRVLRATPMFTRIIMVSMFSIFAVYLVDMVLGFFGHSIPMVDSSSPVGIIFSLIVVAVASGMLIIDFDQIERAAAARMPKFMEWYCGFSLLVTLVWLYLEILNLLRKLNDR